MRSGTIPAGLTAVAAALLLTAPFATAAPAQDTGPGTGACIDATIALSAGQGFLDRATGTGADLADIRAEAAAVLDVVPDSVTSVDALLDDPATTDDATEVLTRLRAALIADNAATSQATDVDLDALTAARDEACADPAGDGPTGEPAPTSDPAPTGEPTPPADTESPAPTTGEDSGQLYGSCADVRAAGAAPLLITDTGYRADLDSDADGVACEDTDGAPVGDGFGQVGEVPTGSADTGQL